MKSGFSTSAKPGDKIAGQNVAKKKNTQKEKPRKILSKLHATALTGPAGPNNIIYVCRCGEGARGKGRAQKKL